jgi:hypothetical protein
MYIIQYVAKPESVILSTLCIMVQRYVFCYVSCMGRVEMCPTGFWLKYVLS